MSRKHRRGTLSDEDRALWRTVTTGVKPLHSDQAKPPSPEAEPPSSASSSTAGAAVPKVVAKANGRAHRRTPLPPPAAGSGGPTTRAVKAVPSLAGIDRRTLREIFRGARAVEGRVDLHGLTQAEAHGRLIGFLRGAQSRGARLVLVITGKSRGWDDAGHERGVLRRVTPHWLGSAELRSIVLGFSSAGPGHGGEGAFYVRLRRKRG